MPSVTWSWGHESSTLHPLFLSNYQPKVQVNETCIKLFGSTVSGTWKFLWISLMAKAVNLPLSELWVNIGSWTYEQSPDEILERHESSHKNTRRNVESETDSNKEPQETRFVLVLRYVLYFIIFGALGGKFLTGSYLWEYEGKWIRLRTYFPVSSCVHDAERMIPNIPL